MSDGDLVKSLYRPVGLLASLGAGALAGRLFSALWKRLSRDGTVPGALNSEDRLVGVVAAAVVQAAIFAVVQAVVDRGGARIYQRITGEWPGE